MASASGGAYPMMTKSERDYRAESDHRTLCDAVDIRSDKKRLAAVADHHRSITAKHRIVGRSLRGRGRR